MGDKRKRRRSNSIKNILKMSRRKLIMANQKKEGVDDSLWDDLVYYFNFDNNIREHVNGIDGTNPNGTLIFSTHSKSGTYSLDTTGVANRGATVSGIPLSLLGEHIDNLTISTWVNIPGNLSSYIEIFSSSVLDLENRLAIYLSYASDSKIYFDMPASYNQAGDRFVTKEILYDYGFSEEWVHLVFVATPTHNHIYINGSLFESFTNKKDLKLNTAGQAFNVAKRSDAVNVGNCLIDSCAVWNRALSENNVSALFNNGNGLFYV